MWLATLVAVGKTWPFPVLSQMPSLAEAAAKSWGLPPDQPGAS